MSWVKRNLYFLIGSTLAVVLLVLAGFYFVTNYHLNDENLKKLNERYDELDTLARAKPNPGNKEIDNIEISRQQEAEVRGIMEKERKHFSPIIPIPNPPDKVVTKDEFASALRRTMDELANAAAAASVTLPPKYSFSFEAERALTIFAPGSLEPLSVKLGKVKTICNVLYQAKVNSLDNLRRERVSADDLKGPASDFLEIGSLSNQLAVLTPYEVGFHCFSPELASVLAAFANDPHGFIVKAVNVEPGAALTAGGDTGGGATPAATPAMGKGNLPVMMDEKRLKVTLVIQLVKLLPKK